MIIDSSVIGMESARRFTSSQKRTAKFAVMDYKGNEAHKEKANKEDRKENAEDGSLKDVSEKETAKKEPAWKNAAVDMMNRADLVRASRLQARSSRSSALENFRQYTIRSIFAMFFGKEKADKIFGDCISGKYTLEQNQVPTYEGYGNGGVSNPANGQTAQNVLMVSEEYYYEETESTSFATTGMVKTADGREISINLNVSMSRRFSEYFSQEMQVMKVNTCDPLVLNFEGGAAELSDQKFFFDLDSDGEADSISELKKGSGYLALDRNEDGIINDGSELFGTASGDGFADLAAYDEDGNGWIDENDSVFAKLKIWCRDEEGNNILYSLKEKNVGAICLSNVGTEFSEKGAGNVTNGIIRSTGIFLYESGLAGTIQHLDLAQ